MLNFPKTLATTTTTFTVPPLAEDRHTIPELYDFHLENSPEHPLFVYDDAGQRKTIRFREAVPAMHRAAHYIHSAVNEHPLPEGRPVIAILAATETIAYFSFVVGCMRAGYTVFALSPRNNPPAVTHLLEKVGATHICVSGQPALKGLCAASLAGLSKKIPVLDMPEYDTLYTGAEFVAFPKQTYDRKAPAVILHSSGSTSFPKPIIRTHEALVEPGRTPWYGDAPMTGVVFSAHALPVFHGFGVINVGIVACCGVVLSVFSPKGPMALPTPESVMASAIADDTEVMVCVPTFVEAWSRAPEGVAFLQKLKGVIYAGGPLNKDVGDRLADAGVQIHCVYATTETGVLSKYLRVNPGKTWDYLEFSPHVNPTMIPYEESDDGVVEIVVKENELLQPMVTNTTIDGVPAYATSDLLMPHPTIPGLYKIHGRADDQIMLSTGEKTNPGPLETILSQDPRIHAAVMFGRERTSNGVIVAPKPNFAFDPESDEKMVERFRNDIWPTVEKLNAFAPTHSRVFKEMILVEKPSKPFQYTAKSTVRRQLVLSEYQTEIDELYRTVEASAQEIVAPPAEWTAESSLVFVRELVGKVLNKTVGDDADVFQHGCDSLQATWIRNGAMGALQKTVNLEASRRVPSNMMYLHPTIQDLAQALLAIALSKGAPVNQEDVIAKKLAEMEAMVKKYTADFPARPSGSNTQDNGDGDVVLLTGSTGVFGSGLLHNLLASKEVKKVYAVNRKSTSSSIEERQRAALSWDHEDVLSNPEARAKLVLLETDTGDVNLGLSGDIYAQVQAEVTHIIHNAWRVDFNLSLSTFESSVRGVRNLVDLALTSTRPSPPRLLFVSSVGVFNRPTSKGLFKEVPVEDARTAIGFGYGEAKWIGEQILLTAAKETSLQPIIVRPGQITSNKAGYWKETEWFPSIVKSSKTLGVLPDLVGNVTWMPAYQASRALTEMRNSSKPVLHLVHPKGVSWSSILTHFSQNLGVPLVPYPKWLEALNHQVKSKPAAVSEVELMQQNPALRLAEHFSAVDLDEDREPLGIVRLDPSNAVEISQTLASMEPLGEQEVKQWVAGWKASGFL